MSGTDAPSMDGLPVLGHALSMFRDPFEFADRIGERGDVVAVRVLNRTYHYVDHPEAIRQVLVADSAKFRKPALLSESLDDVAPNMVIAIDGEQWRRISDVVRPAFTARAVQAHASAMVEETVDAVDDWDHGDRIDVGSEMKALSLSILGRALFGGDFGAIEHTMADVTRAMNDRFDPPAQFVPTWVPTRTNRRFRRAMDDLDDLIADLLVERRARDDPGEDLFGLLVAAADDGRLSDAELRDQVFTFLFAGHETTALALTFAWHLLGTHPEARERLQAEADALDGDPGIEDLPDLPFTECVARETLRLYPPSYELWREATEPVELRSYHLPAGSKLFLPTYSVHRDERWWDAPDEFRPGRWLDEELPDPEYAYFPFGGGPRGCIGMRFATLEIRLVLATLARRFRLEPTDGQSPDLDLRLSLTLQPSERIEMIVHDR